MHFDESAEQRRHRLGQLVDRLALAALVFGGIEAVAAQIYRDRIGWWSSIVMIGYGVVALGAAQLNRRGRTELGCAVATTGLLLATAALAPLQPELHVPLTLVPLLAAVVAYPYLSGRPLALLLFAVVLETAGVHWLGEILPPATHLPRAFHLIFRPVATSTVVGLITYFLWLHRSRLEERFRDEVGRRGRLEQAIGELSAREREARRRAWHDPLTGLANRELGLERLAGVFEGQDESDRRAALVFVDLDDFKAINDAGGHAAGDEVLREVAQQLASVTRGTDTLARFGGDEFFLVMPRIDAPLDVEMVARRLMRRLATHGPKGPGGAAMRASLGLAMTPEHGRSPEAMLRAADAAMYRAKWEGGGRYAWAEAEARAAHVPIGEPIGDRDS
jgi:diguanylate cyclase (GGDEF)-like protein